MNQLAFLFLVCGFLISGCSKVPPADDYFVASTVESRIDSQTKWRQGGCQDVEVSAFIAGAVSGELTADSAIQIALFNNPKIQSIFEELGIAQADLVEAGLLTNPVLECAVRYPHSKGFQTNIEYLITSSLLDIFLIPLRTRLASTEFAQTKLRVSHEILDVAFEVRETYYELVAEERKVLYLQSIVELTSILSDLSAKQIAIGNINNLEFQLSQSKLLEAELELEESQAEIIQLREKLNSLLGFTDDFCLILPKNLPDEFDMQSMDLCSLETTALQKRLDLQVARLEIMRMSQMLGLKDWWTYTNLKVGVAGERALERVNAIGPGFFGEVPIFNYGQAARMRLFAQLRQAQERLAVMEINILSEVRESYKLLMKYKKILNNYKNCLLPIGSQISISSEELYNVMGLGVDKLLENKRQEIMANKNYTESVKKFLMARVKLDRALDGYLFKEGTDQ